jgi:hypothetical protein
MLLDKGCEVRGDAMARAIIAARDRGRELSKGA